jgi:hypothetical protein
MYLFLETTRFLQWLCSKVIFGPNLSKSWSISFIAYVKLMYNRSRISCETNEAYVYSELARIKLESTVWQLDPRIIRWRTVE